MFSTSPSSDILVQNDLLNLVCRWTFRALTVSLIQIAQLADYPAVSGYITFGIYILPLYYISLWNFFQFSPNLV